MERIVSLSAPASALSTAAVLTKIVARADFIIIFCVRESASVIIAARVTLWFVSFHTVVRKVSLSKNKGIKKKNKKENIPGTDNEKPHPALSSTSVVGKTTISFASSPDKAFI